MTKILVVEDEDSFSDALAFLLQKEGFETVVADTGPKAIAEFEKSGADLILLDLMLPGLSGTEVCRQIRTRSQVPIIMLTAKDTEVDKVVGTSKTLRTLAKMSQDWLGDSEKRLTRDCLDEMVPKLLKMKASERNELPGVSKTRAHQIVAGAMVARQTLHAIGVDQIQICPWALREGVILKRLDWLEV